LSTFAIDFFGMGIYVYAGVEDVTERGVIPSISASLDGVVTNCTNVNPYADTTLLYSQSDLALGWHHLNMSLGQFGPGFADMTLALVCVNVTTGDGLTRSVNEHGDRSVLIIFDASYLSTTANLTNIDDTSANITYFPRQEDESPDKP
jgi:hypothetical protein